MAFAVVCAGAPDTAHRGVRVKPGVNKGGTTQALLRPLGRRALVYFSSGRASMSEERISALCVVLAGLLIAGFAKTVCRRAQNVPQVRSLGVMMMIIGAILWFLP